MNKIRALIIIRELNRLGELIDDLIFTYDEDISFLLYKKLVEIKSIIQSKSEAIKP